MACLLGEHGRLRFVLAGRPKQQRVAVVVLVHTDLGLAALAVDEPGPPS